MDSRTPINPPDETGKSLKAIRSEQLFDHKRCVHILHDGKVYRLTITRQNKLILTK